MSALPDVSTVDAILWRHDLVGIAHVDPHEYDIEAHEITSRIAPGMGIDGVAVIIHAVFVEMFTPNLVPLADDAVYRDIAAEILAGAE